MLRLRAAALLALGSAALAGCATPPPAAITAYTRTDCAASPDVASAISLTPKDRKAIYAVTTPVDATAPCLIRPGGGVSPYRVYALGKDTGNETLTVGSLLEATRLVPPDVSMLDAQGKVTRTFAPTDYFFRGTVYSVQLRPRQGEAYVLIAMDPARVGQKYDSIAIGTETNSTYVAGSTMTWRTGTDTKVSRTFSYEGSVQVTVYDNSADKPKS